MTIDLEPDAAQLFLAAHTAKKFHGDQVRKYTGQPYIVHPWAVAGLVHGVTSDIDMVIAALLHDTVEDTELTIDTLEVYFGMAVASLVEMLTDPSVPSDGNRKVRKQIDLDHTASASPDAKTIKLADLIDNTTTIVTYDPDFARVYMHEKGRLLEVLTEGNEELYSIAKHLHDMYYEGRNESK